MKKERIKGFVAGVLLMMMLSATLVFASPSVMREIHYGVSVVLNGRVVHFDADSQPFVMGGRTFLPLRTMADMLGLPVEFDAETNTVYMGYTNAADLLLGRWTEHENIYRLYYRSGWRGFIEFFADRTGIITRTDIHNGEEQGGSFLWNTEGNFIIITWLDFYGEEGVNRYSYFSIARDVMNGDEILILKLTIDGQITYADWLIRIND